MTPKKIIIVNSPLFRYRNEKYDEDSLPPIGLGYIATALEHAGMDVEMIDAVDRRIPLDELLGMLHDRQPDVIGVNIFTTNYELVKDLVEGYHMPVHFVVGGLSTKQLYQKILEWETENPIDVVTGDGEAIMPDIVQGTLKEAPFIEKGNRSVFKVDNCSQYMVSDINNIPLNRCFFSNEPIDHPLGFREANIVASRGCVYNCTFCAAARSLNGEYKVRERDAASLIRELSDIQEQFPQVNSIRVLDDLFLKSRTQVKTAIEVFSHFHYQWRSMAHVQTFKGVEESMMNDLAASGCHELFIGIESGSPKILEQINKTKDLNMIRNNLEKAFKAGINIKGYFIYGFPGETAEDMQMTFALASELMNIAEHYNVNFRTSVFQYRPYHATQIYHELQEKGVDLEVNAVAPNERLSRLVGRNQFNFHSGNYSAVGIQVVEDYIYRTINLNGGNIFSGLSRH